MILTVFFFSGKFNSFLINRNIRISGDNKMIMTIFFSSKFYSFLINRNIRIIVEKLFSCLRTSYRRFIFLIFFIFFLLKQTISPFKKDNADKIRVWTFKSILRNHDSCSDSPTTTDIPPTLQKTINIVS